jgi:hypothetical protein
MTKRCMETPGFALGKSPRSGRLALMTDGVPPEWRRVTALIAPCGQCGLRPGVLVPAQWEAVCCRCVRTAPLTDVGTTQRHLIQASTLLAAKPQPPT